MRSAVSPGYVLVLNGGSSSGKTTIGRALQSCLEGTWLLIGIDALIWTLPVEMVGDPAGIEVIDGMVRRGSGFMEIYDGFRHAVASFARCGVNVILDEVLLGGGVDQAQWVEALLGVETCWVGVHCDADLAASREVDRGDRPVGVARMQATRVHEDVRYDLQLETDTDALSVSAGLILAELQRRWSIGFTDLSAERSSLPPISALRNAGVRRPAPWEAQPAEAPPPSEPT
jgi:chloramphenicol 3-O phosphotransferase